MCGMNENGLEELLRKEILYKVYVTLFMTQIRDFQNFINETLCIYKIR